MADGDLLLTLVFQQGYVPGPPDPVPPAMDSCGAELYEAMRPLAALDHENGWALAHLCAAIGAMRQSVSDIVRDRDVAGWSAATDPLRAPGADSEIDMLPFLGQLVGVSGLETLDDADRRNAIRRRDGSRRGTVDSIVSAAQRYMRGTRRVLLRERFDRSAAGDAPHRLQVVTRRSETAESDWPRVVNMLPNPTFRRGYDNGVQVIETLAWNSSVAQVGDGYYLLQGTPLTDNAQVAISLPPVAITPDAVLNATANFSVTPYLSSELYLGLQWLDARGSRAGSTFGPVSTGDGSIAITNAVAPASARAVQVTAWAMSSYVGLVSISWSRFVLVEGRSASLEFADGDTPGYLWQGAPSRSPTILDFAGPMRAAVRAAIPAGLFADIDVTEVGDFEAVREDFDTFEDLRRAFATFDDVTHYGS